ncbi:MAG: diguanylate cyclase [Pseudomonadota bacterium]
MAGEQEVAGGERPLIQKLMVAWSLSILGAVVAAIVVISFQMTNRLEETALRNARILLELAEAQTRRYATDGDVGRLAKTITAMGDVLAVREVTLFHKPTFSFFRSGDEQPLSINRPPEALSIQVLETGEPGDLPLDDGVLLARPLAEAGGAVMGVLTIEVARPTRFETMFALFSEKLLIGILAAASAFVLAAHFARKAVSPIRAAIRVADRVAEGDLTMPEKIGGSREAALLELSLSRMIFRLEQSHMRIRDLAFRDQITRLSNRADFNLRGRALLRNEPAEGEDDMLRALFFVDLDGFKMVNDTYGHEMGDRVLRVVADRLREVVRADDELRNAGRIAGALGDNPDMAPLLARLGGDEFTLLLGCLNCTADAELVANRVLEAIRAEIALSGVKLHLGASIGIALSAASSKDEFSELLRRADVAMYVAKNAGKDAFRVYAPEMDQTAA